MPDTVTSEIPAVSTQGEVRIGGLDHVVLRVGRPRSRDRVLPGCAGPACRARIAAAAAGPAARRRLADRLVPAALSPQGALDQAARNIDHFAVRVIGFDASALKAHLQRHGVDPGEVHERYGAEGYGPSIYITDPDGNTVELKGEATRGL